MSFLLFIHLAELCACGDGIIQHDNLARGQLTETWLREVAQSAGYPDLAQVLFLCLNTQGEMLIQGKSSTKTELKSVLKPEKVVW